MNNIVPNEQNLQDTGISAKTFNFPVKVSEKMEVNITLQYPMEEKDLHKFLATLEALRPGLLQSVLDEENGKDN